MDMSPSSLTLWSFTSPFSLSLSLQSTPLFPSLKSSNFLPPPPTHLIPPLPLPMDFQKPDATAAARRMMTVMREKETQQVKYEDEEGFDDYVAEAGGEEEGEEEIIERVDIEEKRQRRLTGAAGRKVGGTGGGGGGLSCQTDKCTADLTEAKRYHRRHKVCEFHAKAPSVLVSGLRQRFCQQCSRFHELSEFDETKRSCRRRLAGHNERRRKSTSEPNEEGGSSSSGRMKGPSPHCRPNDPERPSRVQMPYPGNPVFKYR